MRRRRYFSRLAARSSCWGRRSDRQDGLIRRIASAGGDAIAKPIDVRRRDDLSAFVAAAQQRYDRLDVLVNNAGVMPVSPLDALCVDDWN